MTSPRFASAYSLRHDSTLALREAANSLRDGLDGRSPDLLVLFASPHHAAEYDVLASRAGSMTGARVLVGCAGESVIGGAHELERTPALSLWAVSCDDLDLHPFRLAAHLVEGPAPDGPDSIAFPGHLDFGSLPHRPGDSLLLFGDPYTFPVSDYLEKLHRDAPGLPVTGGLASGARQPGESALFLGGERRTQGAVGVYLRGGIELTNVISQAYRPVGRPMVITSADGTLVKKLGGKKAHAALLNTLNSLPADVRATMRVAPMLGVAWDPMRSQFDASDFLAHPIRGIAPQEEALVLTSQVRTGQTVQFMIRDASAAGDDLSERLDRYAGGPPATPNEAGALVFTCNGRGSRMFEEPDHDASRVQAHLGEGVPVAGFFAGGEIGVLGDRSQLQGFTASTAVYRARS
jgi:small ligand-binding sensory domain FIST